MIELYYKVHPHTDKHKEHKMVKNTELVVEAATGTAFTYRGVKPGDSIRYCNCGCNLQVVKKAIYRPGHDARHVSQIAIEIIESQGESRRGAKALVKAIRDGIEQLPSTALRMKLVARLAKSLDERHLTMLATLQQEVIDALDEDSDDES